MKGVLNRMSTSKGCLDNKRQEGVNRSPWRFFPENYDPEWRSKNVNRLNLINRPDVSTGEEDKAPTDVKNKIMTKVPLSVSTSLNANNPHLLQLKIPIHSILSNRRDDCLRPCQMGKHYKYLVL